MKHATLFPLLLLAACGSGPDTPSGVTPGEAQALNDAAAMLDANSVDANALSENEIVEEQPQ